jgi:ubiquinone/menaquinone biosynthesis C-methylase UbiE
VASYDQDSRNVDVRVVEGFGDEWSRFDQSELDETESKKIFDDYFSVFPWESLPPNPSGFDLGCGTGRWAKHVAQRIGDTGLLHCIDPSAALDAAKRNLESFANCHFHSAGVDAIPLVDGSMDFGYSLGVLHHVPDTQAGINSCVAKLKPGAPFLIYLYYAFDNRPKWFRLVWKASDFVRRLVCRLPHRLRFIVSQLIAVTVYWPLATLATVFEKFGFNVEPLPLSSYRGRSFYTLRTDALDRFGTSLEQRFTRDQIAEMLSRAGLERISFREDSPFWCAVGFRSLS